MTCSVVKYRSLSRQGRTSFISLSPICTVRCIVATNSLYSGVSRVITSLSHKILSSAIVISVLPYSGQLPLSHLRVYNSTCFPQWYRAKFRCYGSIAGCVSRYSVIGRPHYCRFIPNHQPGKSVVPIPASVRLLVWHRPASATMPVFLLTDIPCLMVSID